MITVRKSPQVRRMLKFRPRGLYGGVGSMVHGVELENCNQTNVPDQFACSLRNQALVNASYDEHPGSYLGDGVYANTPAAVAIYGGTATVQQQQQPTYTPSYSPRLSFANSRGGNILYPGDTWTVSIAGGAPNSQVVVQGGKNGATGSNVMGNTDGGGNFSLSGTLTPDTVGSWSETWSVGGTVAGSFSFVVQPVASSTTQSTAQNPSGSTGSTLTTGGGTSAVNTGGGASPAGFSFGDIPWWAYAAAGALFFFGGGRGR